MLPNTDNEILIPNNMLQIDLHEREHSYREYDVVRRDGKLYDRVEHTNKWTSGEMKCDVVWHFDWVDLPIPIQDYITSRAATFVVDRIVGDAHLHQVALQKEAYCRAMALEYECNQAQHTFFGSPKGGNHYTSYQPYTALKR
jgi:hypothetical protein